MKKSIKVRLLERDLTVPDLAEAIGKSTVYVSNALNFKTVFRADEAFKIGDMLGMTAEEVRAELAETPYKPKEKNNVKPFKAAKT